jgi:hypothetical protein
MSWAAYAFINQTRTQATTGETNEEIADWWALVSHALSLVSPAGEAPFAIVASVSDIQFRRTDEIHDQSAFPEGRIFGRMGEVRWRPWCTGRHVMLVTDAETNLASLREMGFQDAMQIEASAQEPVPHVLWGELEDDGKWRDGRIPRDLAYPAPATAAGRSAWLTVKRYVDEGGIVQFARYVDVVAERGELP